MEQQRQLLINYLKPIWPRVALLMALIFTGIGLQLANPQIIRYFIDTAVGGADSRPLLLAALAFLGISLLAQVTSIAAVYVGEDVGWRATNRLRADLTRHCLGLDMAFHNAHTPGEMIERIDGDILNLANFFSRFVIRVLGNVLLLVGVLVVLAFVDWRITLALLSYIVLGLGGLVGLRQIAVPHWEAARQASANLFGFLEERLAGTEDVRSSGAVGHTLRQLFGLNRAYLHKELRGATAGTLIIAIWAGLYVAGQAVGFAMSYYLLGAGVITIGAVYLVIYYTHFVFLRLAEIADQLQDLQRAGASIVRVAALLAERSAIQSPPAPAALPGGPLAVEFDAVTFRYGELEPVLRDVSFRLAPGKVLGLLGRTGSGKTTITRLLFRLYDPASGSIRLGAGGPGSKPSADLRDLELAALRQRIGMVTQHVELFNASVRDNVTLFDARIPDAEVRRVIAELGLSDWLAALPDGLDTMLDSGGGNLSAGESQLLAFARVFLRDPDLVILDEASSRLDPVTEQRIERAIDALLADRTGIIVAHRLNTVRRADQVMIIERGQVQEFGDYGALANDPSSRFARLLQTGLTEVLA